MPFGDPASRRRTLGLAGVCASRAAVAQPAGPAS